LVMLARPSISGNPNNLVQIRASAQRTIAGRKNPSFRIPFMYEDLEKKMLATATKERLSASRRQWSSLLRLCNGCCTVKDKFTAGQIMLQKPKERERRVSEAAPTVPPPCPVWSGNRAARDQTVSDA
jgi:hypothetical protein